MYLKGLIVMVALPLLLGIGLVYNKTFINIYWELIWYLFISVMALIAGFNYISIEEKEEVKNGII